MRTPTSLSALLLSFATVVAQDQLTHGLVVRYDAATVRLHDDLLGTLLTPSLCKAVQARVWGEEAAGHFPLFNVWITPLDVPQGAREGFQQPEGVFAAILHVGFRNEAPEEERAEIADAVLAGLQQSLKQRLTEGPREWLARQRDSVFEETVRAQQQLEELRGKLQALPAASLETMVQRWSGLREQRAVLQLDLHTERATLHLLQDRMAEARARLEQARTQRQKSEAVLADLQAELRRAEAEIARTGESTEAFGRLAARLGEIRAEIAHQSIKRDELVGSRPRAEERVQRIGRDIEATSLNLHRLESRLGALNEQIEMHSQTLSEAGATAGKRADLEFRIRLLEQEIERLRQRASELTERMGGLREVQVELWR